MFKGRYKYTLFGLLGCIACGIGAVVLYAQATSTTQVIALSADVEKGDPINTEIVRRVNVSSPSIGNLIRESQAAEWIANGYVASAKITGGAWLRPGDFVPPSGLLEGWVIHPVKVKAPPEVNPGGFVRLYENSGLLGVYPFPCWAEPDVVVEVAQHAGISDVGWRQQHAELLGVSPERIATIAAGESTSWDWYRLMVAEGRAGLAPGQSGSDLYGLARGLSVYNPRIHLRRHYDLLCGMILLEVVEILGEERDTVKLKMPLWLVPSVQSAEISVIMPISQEEATTNRRYLTSDTPPPGTNLWAPLIAQDLSEQN